MKKHNLFPFFITYGTVDFARGKKNYCIGGLTQSTSIRPGIFVNLWGLWNFSRHEKNVQGVGSDIRLVVKKKER